MYFEPAQQFIEGFYLRLSDGQHSVYSEVGGLTNLSELKLENSFVKLFIEVCSAAELAFTDTAALYQNYGLAAPLCFALDSLIWQFRSANEQSFGSLKPQVESIKVNALLFGDKLLEQAQPLYEEGYRVFKIKVTSTGLSNLIEEIKNLLAALPDIELRLDANQGLSQVQAEEISAALPAIDYFEEPTVFTDLPFEAMPIALDECLREGQYSKRASALIIKPALSGSFAEIDRLCQQARLNRQRIVFTSNFESNLHLLARLAACYSPDEVHGLDTWRFIGDVPLQPGFSVEGGQHRLRDPIKIAQHVEFSDR